MYENKVTRRQMRGLRFIFSLGTQTYRAVMAQQAGGGSCAAEIWKILK